MEVGALLLANQELSDESDHEKGDCEANREALSGVHTNLSRTTSMTPSSTDSSG